MIHRDYFAADDTARNRMHGQTHHGISGGFCHKCGLCRSRYAAFVAALCGHMQFRLTVTGTSNKPHPADLPPPPGITRAGAALIG